MAPHRASRFRRSFRGFASPFPHSPVLAHLSRGRHSSYRLRTSVRAVRAEFIGSTFHIPCLAALRTPPVPSSVLSANFSSANGALVVTLNTLFNQLLNTLSPSLRAAALTAIHPSAGVEGSSAPSSLQDMVTAVTRSAVSMQRRPSPPSASTNPSVAINAPCPLLPVGQQLRQNMATLPADGVSGEPDGRPCSQLARSAVSLIPIPIEEVKTRMVSSTYAERPAFTYNVATPIRVGKRKVAECSARNTDCDDPVFVDGDKIVAFMLHCGHSPRFGGVRFYGAAAKSELVMSKNTALLVRAASGTSATMRVATASAPRKIAAALAWTLSLIAHQRALLLAASSRSLPLEQFVLVHVRASAQCASIAMQATATADASRDADAAYLHDVAASISSLASNVVTLASLQPHLEPGHDVRAELHRAAESLFASLRHLFGVSYLSNCRTAMPTVDCSADHPSDHYDAPHDTVEYALLSTPSLDEDTMAFLGAVMHCPELLFSIASAAVSVRLLMSGTVDGRSSLGLRSLLQALNHAVIFGCLRLVGAAMDSDPKQLVPSLSIACRSLCLLQGAPSCTAISGASGSLPHVAGALCFAIIQSLGKHVLQSSGPPARSADIVDLASNFARLFLTMRPQSLSRSAFDTFSSASQLIVSCLWQAADHFLVIQARGHISLRSSQCDFLEACTQVLHLLSTFGCESSAFRHADTVRVVQTAAMVGRLLISSHPSNPRVLRSVVSYFREIDSVMQHILEDAATVSQVMALIADLQNAHQSGGLVLSRRSLLVLRHIVASVQAFDHAPRQVTESQFKSLKSLRPWLMTHLSETTPSTRAGTYACDVLRHVHIKDMLAGTQLSFHVLQMLIQPQNDPFLGPASLRSRPDEPSSLDAAWKDLETLLPPVCPIASQPPVKGYDRAPAIPTFGISWGNRKSSVLTPRRSTRRLSLPAFAWSRHRQARDGPSRAMKRIGSGRSYSAAFFPHFDGFVPSCA